MNKNSRRITTFAVSAVLILNILFTTNVFAADTLTEARSVVRDYYYQSVPDSVLNAPTIDEMIKGLNDPYSTYFTAKEFDDFLNSIENKLVGIGVHIDLVSSGVKVVSTMAGSPAETAGLISGDIITSADGHALAGLSAEEATSYIKGEEGTNVELVIDRNGALMNFTVARQAIESPTLESKVIGSTGYIYISTFGEKTSEEFLNAIKDFNTKNVQSYIIDLRDDPGGYVDTALNIAGYFVGNKTVFTGTDKNGYKTDFKGVDHGYILSNPVKILVNQNSASASEIFTACLKDYKKAFVIGTRTFGKGLMQSMYQLSDGSVIKLTVEKFVSPLGNAINKVGVKPNYYIDDSKFDALGIAELISAKSGSSIDKTGYVKITSNGSSFEIKLSDALKKQNKDTFNYIITSSIKNGFTLSIGTKTGYSITSNLKDSRVINLISPCVTFVGVEHSPLVAGDTESFYITSKNADKVQYRAFIYSEQTKVWSEITNDYSAAVDGNQPYAIDYSKPYDIGKYKVSVWVKRAGETGIFKNSYGDYDNYYTLSLNCVNKDDSNRVYVNGNMNINSSIKAGDKVTISNIENLSGMQGPYKYKLHIYDADNDKWIMNVTGYGDTVEWTPQSSGNYIIDLWVMSANSTLWNREAELKSRIYEAWKLKNIQVIN